MIEIKLKEGQNGYDVIAEYIQRYWKREKTDTVIISIGTSYDGNTYYFSKEIATPICGDDIEFLNDWWEGEKYIRLFGIRSLKDINIVGGIYEP